MYRVLASQMNKYKPACQNALAIVERTIRGPVHIDIFSAY